MKIVIVDTGKQFDNKKQALLELAFCHYPVTVEIDGDVLTFEWFSDIENYFNNLHD